MKFILSIFFLLFSLSSHCQSFELKGQIGINQEDLGLGQITVFSIPDSTLIKGSYIDTTTFSLIVTSTGNNEYFAKVSITGYTDTIINFQNSGDSAVDLGIIKLQKDVTLNTVDIVYQKPTYVRNIDGIKVNVEGTTLETLDNLFEILKASPRLMSSDDESIEIIGKGVPLIFVDRQPIISIEELKAIPANMVDRIEIITNPSSKYRAQGRENGVIEIFTKNFRFEGYNMSVNAQGGIISQISPVGSLGIALSLKKAKFSFTGSVYGRYLEQTNTGSIDRTMTDGSNRSTTWEFHNSYRNFSQNVNLKAAYRFNENHTLSGGIRANGFINKSNSEWSGYYLTNGIQDIKEDQIATDELTWINNSAFLNYIVLTDTNQSNLEINLNYQLKVNEGAINHLTDYLDISTNNFQEFNMRNSYRNRPNIAELRSNYEHIFDTSGWKLSAGASYSIIFNKKELEAFRLIDSDWIIDTEFSNSYDYQEHIGATFFELTKDWSKVSVRAGIRGEITALDGYSNSLAMQFIDSVYVLPFPSASIIYHTSEKLSVTARYTSGINRPQFYNFDPFIRLTDSLTREQGNPYLLPATTHNLGVDFDLFQKYRISIDHSITKNPTTRQMYVEDSSFLFVFIPWNAKRSQSTSISVGFPLRTSWVDGWTYANFSYNNFEFPSEFNFSETESFTYVLWSSLNFHLKGQLTITNQVYVFKHASFAYSQKARVRWNIRITKRMLQNKLSISLIVNDILPPKADFTNEANNYREMGVRNDLFTDFQIGILYKFGRLKNDVRINETESGQSDRL